MTIEGLATLLLAAILCAACAWDTASRRIPNVLIATGLVLGLACGAIAGHLGHALVGAAVGLLALLPFFAMHWLGAGDVKLLAVIGAFTGPAAIPGIVLYSAIAGGALGAAVMVARLRTASRIQTNVLADGRSMTVERSAADIGAAASTRSNPSATLPYALALAVGTLAHQIGAQL